MKEKLYSYFDTTFNLRYSSNGWYRMVNVLSAKCLRKKDETLAINFDYGWCNCLRTGMSMSLMNFVMQFEGIDYRDAKELIMSQDEVLMPRRAKESTVRSKIELPEHFTPILSGNTTFGKRARKYLIGRGFDLDYLDELGFGYCPEGKYLGYVIIPFKRKGSLIYYTGRNFLGWNERYKNPKKEEIGIGKSELLFNEDCLSTQSKVYLTEGVFDAITCFPGSCAYSGSKVSDTQIDIILHSPVKELVVVSDKGFYQKNKSFFLKYYENKRIKILNLDNEPPEKKDANDIGFSRVKQLEESTDYLTFNNFFS